MSRPSPITAARARHGLAEVAARTGVDHYRTSGSVSVRCPLPSHGHLDRTPSLRLHLDDGIFSCFGCGAKGDIVEWVRQTEGVDWREAIRILDAGRPLTNAWAGKVPAAGERSQHAPAGAATGTELAGRLEAPDLARTPPQRIYAALDAAWGYYTYPPLRHRGEDYLLGRGIDVRVLEVHTGRPEVGYTPAKADGLVTSLRFKGFSDDELVDAGLAQRRLGGGPHSDFYRKRVIIPVRDDQQRVVGLIGRNVGDQQRWAMYKNPPRTAVYDKSVNLYQPLPPPPEPRGRVVVVEGTLDAMAIAVSAIRSGRGDRFCPVTQSGRELSEAQLGRATEMAPGAAILGFDGDEAGLDSARRHALVANRKATPVMVVLLPDGHDPASWLALRGDDGLSAWSVDHSEDRDLPSPMPGDSFLARAGTSLPPLSRQAIRTSQRRTALTQPDVSPPVACPGGLEL